MILVADSGATKTEWRLVFGDGTIKQAQTQGFNPYYQSEADILEGIGRELLHNIPGEPVESIYFYGAGCSTSENISVIRGSLARYFPKADIEVNNDLLGAARAVCLHEAGIACILGTGSGSCLFDGSDIIKNIPSLGFILGDEGSGAYLGKKMIADFLRNHMAGDVQALIRKALNADKETILEHVYKKPTPGRFMAGFARFISESNKLPYFHELIYNGFHDFAKNYILPYKEYREYPVHFVGSIAFYNNDILRMMAKDLGFLMGNVIENPVAGLTLFHTESAKTP